MPESSPEEHLQRAQVLLTGSSEEVLHECWIMVIYNLSNNLSDLFDNEKWNPTIDILRKYGVLNLKADLRNLQDRIIQGFMDTLFRAAVYQATDYRNAKTESTEALAVLKWLLLSGYSPNVRIVIPRTGPSAVTPLQAAIQSGNLDLMEHLLDAGADANLTPHHSEADSPLELALKMHRYGTPVTVRMAKLLSRHGASVNLDRAFHLAIMRREMQLAVGITQQGANPAAALRPPHGFLYEETALGVAAAVGKRETQVVLDLLRSQHPSKPVASFVTADVLVAAAAEGNNDTIRFLHNINPAAVSPNHYGITPLHSAARKGRLRTCQLLLDLQGSYTFTPAYPSPLHLAAYGGHKGIVRLFIDSGADVNAVATLRNSQERLIAIERHGLDTIKYDTPCHLTPL
ncbi:hypothetical protein ACJ41O_013726 [Fusarium nematophilum]